MTVRLAVPRRLLANNHNENEEDAMSRHGYEGETRMSREAEWTLLQADISEGKRWVERLLQAPKKLTDDQLAVAEDLYQTVTEAETKPWKREDASRAIHRFREKLEDSPSDNGSANAPPNQGDASSGQVEEGAVDAVPEVDTTRVDIAVFYREGRPGSFTRPHRTVAADDDRRRGWSFMLSSVGRNTGMIGVYLRRARRQIPTKIDMKRLCGEVRLPVGMVPLMDRLRRILPVEKWELRGCPVYRREGRGRAPEQFYHTLRFRLLGRLQRPFSSSPGS